MEDLPPLLLSISLILLNGAFVAVEFAIARLRRSQIDQIAENKDSNYSKTEIHQAKILQDVLSNINDYVSTCQVGITIASLALGVLAEAWLENVLHPIVQILPWGLNTHAVSILLALVIVTFFHVSIGEVVPKSLALMDPVRSSLTLTYFLAFTHSLFTIPVWILNSFSIIILRFFGVEPKFDEVVHTEDELKIILSASQEEGILEEEEEEMIQSIFEFNDTVAKDVMTPRTDIFCLDESTSIKDAIVELLQQPYSRFPIFDQRLDNITGYVTTRDILRAYYENQGEQPLSSISSEVLKFTDGIYVIDLMKEMQNAKKQIAVLIDEFGGTSGLVTTEDIVEEIFGEIHDEDESTAQQPIQKLHNGDYLIDGLVTLRDVNEELDSNFVSDHYDTIGGLVFGLIGTEPKPGDKVNYGDDYTFVVETQDKQRVRAVRVVHHA